MDLEWNVFLEDFNKKEIKTYNIFSNTRFNAEIQQILSNKNLLREEFEYLVNRELQYNFWAKCEYEIILSDWPPSNKFKEKKVDVYEQVCLNKQIFMDYLWNKKDTGIIGFLDKETFQRIYCWNCGTQRCMGPGTELAAGCKHIDRLKTMEESNEN